MTQIVTAELIVCTVQSPPVHYVRLQRAFKKAGIPVFTCLSTENGAQWEHYTVLLPWGLGVFNLEDITFATHLFPGSELEQVHYLIQACADALRFQAEAWPPLAEQYSELGIEY